MAYEDMKDGRANPFHPHQSASEAIAAFEAAKEAALQATLYEIGEVARKWGIERMVFTGYDTTLYKRGREVRSAKIAKLEDAYCQRVHPQGFQALWTADKGWH